MTQEQLNHVMLLQDRTDELNLLDIANEFIAFNDRQMHFFWTF